MVLYPVLLDDRLAKIHAALPISKKQEENIFSMKRSRLENLVLVTGLSKTRM